MQATIQNRANESLYVCEPPMIVSDVLFKQKFLILIICVAQN